MTAPTPQSTPPTVPPPSGGTNWGRIALIGCGSILVLVLVIVVAAVAYLLVRGDGREPALPPSGIAETTYRSADHTFTGEKADNFVDFSFRHPSQWEVMESETDFIRISNWAEDDVLIETFSVSWLSGPVLEAGMVEEYIRQVRDQQASALPNYRWVAEGPTTVGGREARYSTFQYERETARGITPTYGRMVVVPVSADRGLFLLGMATELAEGVRGPADVGVEGGLRGVFDSFEIHEAATGSSSTTQYPGARVLAPNTTFHSAPGQLEAGDPVRNDGTFYDAYQMYLEAGRTVTVTLESGDFDAYLTAVSPSGTTSDDDDGGGGTNARLELVTDEAGTWTFLANTLSQGESGDYQLMLQVR